MCASVRALFLCLCDLLAHEVGPCDEVLRGRDDDLAVTRSDQVGVNRHEAKCLCARLLGLRNTKKRGRGERCSMHLSDSTLELPMIKNDEPLSQNSLRHLSKVS